jgi:hypothetical protein
MCPDCHKVEANIMWSACAQVRQRVNIKLFYVVVVVVDKNEKMLLNREQFSSSLGCS